MTNPKEKTKPSVPTRTPQKKTGAGMFDNLRPLPHPIEEILGFTSPNQYNQTRPDPSQPDPTQPIPTHPNPTQSDNKQSEVVDSLDSSITQLNIANNEITRVASVRPNPSQPIPTHPRKKLPQSGILIKGQTVLTATRCRRVTFPAQVTGSTTHSTNARAGLSSRFAQSRRPSGS